MGELSEGEIANALGRIHENRMVTAWVQRALHWRLASYRYALERLVISVPSRSRSRPSARSSALPAIVATADAPLARNAPARSLRCRSGGDHHEISLRPAAGFFRLHAGVDQAYDAAPHRAAASALLAISVTPGSGPKVRTRISPVSRASTIIRSAAVVGLVLGQIGTLARGRRVEHSMMRLPTARSLIA